MPKFAKTTKNPVSLRQSSTTPSSPSPPLATITRSRLRPRPLGKPALATVVADLAGAAAVRRRQGGSRSSSSRQHHQHHQHPLHPYPHEDDSVVFVQLTRDRGDVRTAQRQVRRYIQPLGVARRARRPAPKKSRVRFAPSLRQFFDADDAATAVLHNSSSVVIVDETLPTGEPAPKELSVQMTADEELANNGEVHILFTANTAVSASDNVSTAGSMDPLEPSVYIPPAEESDSAMNIGGGGRGGGAGGVDGTESLARFPADLGADFGMLDNGSAVVAGLAPAGGWSDDPFEEFLRDIRASR